MSDKGPIVETRRAPAFREELQRRARAWIPDWDPGEDNADFGRALLEIAARFSSEVAERLARVPEKASRGFLGWLGIKGAAARAARVPLVFRLSANAARPVLALAPVKLQAAVGDATIVFETETDILLAPGQLRAIVAVDPGRDAFYVPPPGLTSPEPDAGLPGEWRVKSFAARGATRLQLDPALGLAPDLILEADGAQYRISEVNADIVTIEPALEAADGLAAQTVLRKVSTFAPFGKARNRQLHALYLGDEKLLDIEAAALIQVSGLPALPDGVKWEYWGKRDGVEGVAWQAMDRLPGSPAVKLQKPKGSVDMGQVGGVQSRWLRAVIATVGDRTPASDAIALRINPANSDGSKSASGAPLLDAVANTTPLVLSQPFYPFGREPRQFDAFYLGCGEAFSKPKALVELDFHVASSNLGPLAFLRIPRVADTILAGVGKDRQLYLLKLNETEGKVSPYAERKPLQPPVPTDGDATQTGPRVQLDEAPAWRPAVWTQDNDFFVAVAARHEVWVWHENAASPNASGWQSYGPVEPAANGRPGDKPPIEGIVYVSANGKPGLVALHDGKLFRAEIGSRNWTRLFEVAKDKSSAPPGPWQSLAPVVPTGDAAGKAAVEHLVAVSDDGQLYWLDAAPGAQPAKIDSERRFAPAIRPVAWIDGQSVMVAGADDSGEALLALECDLNHPPDPPKRRGETRHAPLGMKVMGSALDTLLDDSGSRYVVVLGQHKPHDPQLLAWAPFGDTGEAVAEITMPPSFGVFRPAGPTVAGKYLLVPGEKAALLAGPLDTPKPRHLEIKPEQDLAAGLLDAGDNLDIGDLVTLATPGKGAALASITARSDGSKGAIYTLEQPLGAGKVELSLYRLGQRVEGAVETPPGEPPGRQWLKLEPGHQPHTGDRLRIDAGGNTGLYRVVAPKKKPGPGFVKLNKALPGADTTVDCWLPEAMSARCAPMLRLANEPAAPWDTATLGSDRFRFPGVPPQWRQPLDWAAPDAHSLLVAFDSLPEQLTSADVFTGSLAVNWFTALGETASNPELSWEYWNGKGWWSIARVSDDTANLKHDGKVTVWVPDDIAATDWAGKTDYWIRARLVGGDYGSERVTVIQKPAGDGATQQTIDRNTDDIHAPLVVQLDLSYRLEDAVRPAHVLTQDSGAIRDQSDANRTGGATVDLFTPLGAALERLGAPPVTPEAKPAAPAAAPCGCSASTATETAAAADAGATPAGAASPGLFLGFDAPLQGGPFKVLFKAAAEHDHDAFAPLGVDALNGARFEPLVATDDTRGLGETGLLSFTLSAAPNAADLFGETLHWLRLQPAVASGAAPAAWQPDLEGVYLNAVWAQAAETQEFEMLGSSDGAPGQVLWLGRPPVLDGTLELRVREPLGDEERAQLLRSDPDAVLSAVPGQPGDWVRWQQVDDPADSAAGDRVYAFDEASGQVRFGDGMHGAIPPIGRDAIMAFRYRRTEPGPAGTGVAPANAVTAGSGLNVVTPVESVEAVFAADQAAGGADAEDAARVLRFGPPRLRHRRRVVTAQDLEQMALQLVPELAQARCLRSARGIRLVVVMRGAQALASRARKRELQRVLLAAAPPPLGCADAQGLALADPILRQLAVRLVLSTPSLDDSGQLADHATTAIRALLDPATGGFDGKGWRLGEAPAAADVAACLLDVPHLDSIIELELFETIADGSSQPAPATLRPDELFVLGALDLRVTLPEALP